MWECGAHDEQPLTMVVARNLAPGFESRMFKVWDAAKDDAFAKSQDDGGFLVGEIVEEHQVRTHSVTHEPPRPFFLHRRLNSSLRLDATAPSSTSLMKRPLMIDFLRPLGLTRNAFTSTLESRMSPLFSA